MSSKEELIECRDCNNLFNPKEKLKRGYIDQCNICSRNDVEKYLGRPGAINKSSNITIFRENLGFVKVQLNREKGAGFTTNIGITSTIFACKVEERKGGQ